MIRRGQFAGAEEKVKDAATEGSGDPGYVEKEIIVWPCLFIYPAGERGVPFRESIFPSLPKGSLPSPLFLCGSILIDPLVAGSERKKRPVFKK